MRHQKSRDIKSAISPPYVKIRIVVPEHVRPGNVSLSKSTGGDAAAISFSFDQSASLKLVGDRFFEAPLVHVVLKVQERVLFFKDAVSMWVANKAISLCPLAFSPLEDRPSLLLDLFFCE